MNIRLKYTKRSIQNNVKPKASYLSYILQNAVIVEPVLDDNTPFHVSFFPVHFSGCTNQTITYSFGI